MPKKSSFLEKHGNQLRVIVKVSPKARTILGSAHLKVPLHTDSLAKAEKVKWAIVARLKAQIQEAERLAETKANGGVDAVVVEALEWRRGIAEWEANPRYDEEGEALGDPSDFLSDRAEEIEQDHGLQMAKAFADIAVGRATPIVAFIAAFFSEMSLKPRTKADYRRAVERFTTWTREQRMAGTIEATTRKLAGRYISEALIGTGTDSRTVNKHVSALSSYWRWLIKRGHAEANPWQGQSVSKRKSVTTDGERYKRPFTDEEVMKLLKGDPRKSGKGRNRTSRAWNDLPDVIRIAALSGMRVEEIARLKVADCRGGAFNIREAKTSAGIREVPIHSGLAAIIERRTKGRDGAEFLFADIPTPARGSKQERSMPWVKAFVRYRRDLGVDEREDGKRQSRIDLHSLRRWFVTKAEQSGAATRETIAAVVGHERAGMTFGVYSGGPSLEQCKQCVEAVKLPRPFPD